MRLEEEIAKELASIVRERLGECSEQVKAIDVRLMALEAMELLHGIGALPEDVIDEVSKAISLLAEAPPLTKAGGNPVVVNFSAPNTGKKIKTITTRRDEAGNLVARVIED